MLKTDGKRRLQNERRFKKAAAKLFGPIADPMLVLFDDPPQDTRPCMCEWCSGRQTHRTCIRTKKEIIEALTCADCHRTWHGKRVESFPLRQEGNQH